MSQSLIGNVIPIDIDLDIDVSGGESQSLIGNVILFSHQKQILVKKVLG